MIIKNKYVILVLLCLVSPVLLFSQANNLFKPTKTRILFLLDASGSMKEMWNDKSKFEISKQLIFHLADSLEQANNNIEFGVRVFGHQSPRSLHNCTDSKLEVVFSPKNAIKIKERLDKITPQGYSPIAYSLLQAATDFPKDSLSTNAIILVTDGEEKCGGDPCASALALSKNRVTLKPFIIGLNLPKDIVMDFNCVGTYYDAKDEAAFHNVLNNVVDQAIKNTSLQINLLDIKGNPTISNIAFTMYDYYSGDIRYNFIHTLNEFNLPDTLYINPAGKYNIEVHSIPPVLKVGVELKPGVHNVVSIDMPIGYLNLEMENKRPADAMQCVVREAYSSEILYVQDLNDNEPYIRGDFDLDFLTLPRYTKKLVYVPEEKEKTLTIPKAGTLQFFNVDATIASVYEIKLGEFRMLYEFDKVKEKDVLSLIPGRYAVVFRPKSAPKSDYTKTIYFDITSEKLTPVNLR